MEVQTPQDEELDLLDLLVTLAENWKILIFGPLLAGIAAYGIGLVIPKTYESSASVQVERAGSSFTAPWPPAWPCPQTCCTRLLPWRAWTMA
ncbi:Wzz/FepE/Etk N-terminal domain-containing protein [Comamonas sp. Z3]|uniref:Wzz/FepE/Etk N-terminal domain-containing protein n=1 Tax=Comamonas sp. Z3 TaxID=2601247 RepID=UPI0021052B56|nr:Wzz/FepE/Etk N-terminal domain-containing protein [Comamonas sp. Z3]